MSDFPTFWQRKNWRAYALLPLSFIFAGIAKARKALISPIAQDGCTIVIGNISVGGNGKTPVVIAVGSFLQSQGFAIGVVSRGYKRAGKKAQIITPESRAQDVGDEPFLIAQKLACPVVVDADRVNAIRLLKEHYPHTQIILSDDGLQHYRMARDVELVAIAPDLLLGNGFLLPAGPLRESPKRLNAVDGILYTQNVDVKRMASTTPSFILEGKISDFYDAYGNALSLAGKKVHMLTAIARPNRFLDALKNCGLRIEQVCTLPDHSPMDETLLAQFPEDGAPIMISEKDWTKIITWSDECKKRLAIARYQLILPDEFKEFLLNKIALKGVAPCYAIKSNNR